MPMVFFDEIWSTDLCWRENRNNQNQTVNKIEQKLMKNKTTEGKDIPC